MREAWCFNIKFRTNQNPKTGTNRSNRLWKKHYHWPWRTWFIFKLQKIINEPWTS